jgi:intracellular sulfur oxidation DsrE/DsrF family protein
MTRQLRLISGATAIGLIGMLLLFSSPAMAASGDSVRSYLEISPSNLDDLETLLTTLERSLDTAVPGADVEPIVLILHGDEAVPFTRRQYQANRSLVDRTALLDAYSLLDVRMCETWMMENDVQRSDLPPFIETIRYAPDEVRKLEAEGYQPFGSVKM